MEHKTRRSALKQLAVLTFGSAILMESCKTEATEKSATSHNPLKPVHIPAGAFTSARDGTSFGDGITTGAKVRSEHTNGQLCCMESYLKPKQAGPTPHLHKELDEIMRVLEGAVHVMVGDTITEVRAGDWHLRPHGIVHTFWNAGDVPARFINMFPNQDFLGYFEDTVRGVKFVKEKGLAFSSPEVQKMIKDLDDKYGIKSFPKQLAPIIEKYGLKVYN